MREITLIFYARIWLSFFFFDKFIKFYILNINIGGNLDSGRTSLSRRGSTSQLFTYLPGFRWVRPVLRISFRFYHRKSEVIEK